MKILKYYNHLFEAELAKGILENEGIQSFVWNENLSSLYPVQSFKPALAVAEADMQRATEILEFLPEQPADEKPAND